MTFEPTRFEHAQPFLVAGLRRVHGFADASQELPKQWQAFVSLWPVANRVGEMTYGVMCGSDTVRQQFEYMSGVQVSSFDGLDDRLGRMRVPEAHYAVFTHRGHTSTIHQTWGQIWSSWLSTSGFQPASTPDFERYDERFDPATGAGVIEIWFPVRKAQP